MEDIREVLRDFFGLTFIKFLSTLNFSCVGVDWCASQCCKFDLLAAENCCVENLFDEILIIFCFKFIVNFFKKYLLEMFFAKLTIY